MRLSFGSSFGLTFKFKPKLELVDIGLEEPAKYMTAWVKLKFVCLVYKNLSAYMYSSTVPKIVQL